MMSSGNENHGTDGLMDQYYLMMLMQFKIQILTLLMVKMIL